AGLPVIIWLIDPPLHEFLPSLEELIRETTHLKDTGEDPARLAEREKVLARVEELHEANPMLGLRGVRLSILYPEITRMQVRAVKEGRRTRRDLEVGICGEHGGDPDSIHLCHKLGLNYVSCSPFRVPVARLAAAQAAIGEGTGTN